MKKDNSIELLTGFLMGTIAGAVIELILIVLYNLLCRWRDVSIYNVDRWMLIPLPLFFGISMARAIASLHLEDY
jgi:hypothetical protein